jgi:hypothetical protein
MAACSSDVSGCLVLLSHDMPGFRGAGFEGGWFDIALLLEIPILLPHHLTC